MPLPNKDLLFKAKVGRFIKLFDQNLFDKKSFAEVAGYLMENQSSKHIFYVI